MSIFNVAFDGYVKPALDLCHNAKLLLNYLTSLNAVIAKYEPLDAGKWRR